VDQGARDRRGEEGRRGIRLGRFRRVARGHPGRGAARAERGGGEAELTPPGSARDDGAGAPGAVVARGFPFEIISFANNPWLTDAGAARMNPGSPDAAVAAEATGWRRPTP